MILISFLYYDIKSSSDGNEFASELDALLEAYPLTAAKPHTISNPLAGLSALVPIIDKKSNNNNECHRTPDDIIQQLLLQDREEGGLKLKLDAVPVWTLADTYSSIA